MKVGDSVTIRVCSFNGLIIRLKPSIDHDYEVSYPDENGLPTSRYFKEIELEEVKDNKKFGFRR